MQARACVCVCFCMRVVRRMVGRVKDTKGNRIGKERRNKRDRVKLWQRERWWDSGGDKGRGKNGNH